MKMLAQPSLACPLHDREKNGTRNEIHCFQSWSIEAAPAVECAPTGDPAIKPGSVSKAT